VHERAKLINKDSRKSINFYDATRVLFTHSESCRMSYTENLNYFFIDWTMMPLIAHENYIHTFVSGQADTLERMAQCADLVSQGDLINTECMKNQYWDLLPDLGRIGVCAVSSYCYGFVPRVGFPMIMTKLSLERKSRKMLKELREAAGQAFYASKSAVQNEHLPLIFDMIQDCLEGSEPSDRALIAASKILIQLNLNMEQFRDNFLYLLADNYRQTAFESISPNTKKRFTRKFNEIASHFIKEKKTSVDRGPFLSGSTFDPEIQDKASDYDSRGSDDDEGPPRSSKYRSRGRGRSFSGRGGRGGYSGGGGGMSNPFTEPCGMAPQASSIIEL